MNESRSKVLLFIAAVLALALAMLPWAWILAAPGDPAQFSDTLDYLRFADTLRAAWSGDVPPDLRAFYAVTRFPPLYPLSLSAVGAGLSTPEPAYWLSAALAVAGLVFALLWYQRLELGAVAAGMLALMLAWNPGLFLLALAPRSEALYLPLSLLCLWLAERARHGRGDVLVFALIASTLPLCRSAGLALCVATAAWLWLIAVSSWRRRLIASLVLFLPALLWSWSRSGLPVQLDYVDDLAGHDLLMRLGGVSGLLWERPRAMLGAAMNLFAGPSPSLLASGAALVLLVFAAGGAYIRAKARGLELCYALIYVAICAVWPYTAELPRLLAMLVPVLLAWAWLGAQAMAKHWRAHQGAHIASGAVVLAILLASGGFLLEAWQRAWRQDSSALASFQRRFDYFADADRERALQATRVAASMQQGMRAVSDFVSPPDCVYSIAPQMLWYHSGRRVDARALPYPWPGGALRRALPACRYVLVTNTGSAQLGQPAMYPQHEIGAAAEVVFVVFADAERHLPAAALLRLPEPPAAESR